jgi:hypothetical protein
VPLYITYYGVKEIVDFKHVTSTITESVLLS